MLEIVLFCAVTNCRTVQALYRMDAVNEGELSLQEGEVLTVQSEADGWYFGTNQNGQRGMFPASFVEMLQ